MKSLQAILSGIGPFELHGPEIREISAITLDSRKAADGVLFAAVPGTQHDGHQFIDVAITQGCQAVLCSTLPAQLHASVSYVLVSDVREALGGICRNFFDDPSRKLTLVGVTGTNGKTTVSSLLYQLFTGMGAKCGLISTVNYVIGTESFPSTHTTPDVVSLHALLARMVAEGCSYCFMEVSSHAADQRRIAGLHFAGGIFTNITHDHLDYHGSFANYLKAKQSFFDHLDRDAFAITNRDDRNGQVMIQNTKASRYTYGMHGNADFNGRILERDFSGMLMQMNGQEAWFSLIGAFNAYNLMAVYAAAFLLTEGREDLTVALSKVGRVHGRFEPVSGPNRITAIIDYAHTPDALQNVLETINQIRSRNEQLITVMGCGGNRDRAKRPEMGRIAGRLSDRVILTSDNPRMEDPAAIIEEIKAGVEPQDYKKILSITDRKEAIKTALALAGKGDVILIAGKGHETYQEIQGVKHPFDDRQIITELFNDHF
jgi:UDP-N-acetylmuramoyl-L-alanyl-D-glutamate--2,6-diaminopimelate ligase